MLCKLIPLDHGRLELPGLRTHERKGLGVPVHNFLIGPKRYPLDCADLRLGGSLNNQPSLIVGLKQNLVPPLGCIPILHRYMPPSTFGVQKLIRNVRRLLIGDGVIDDLAHRHVLCLGQLHPGSYQQTQIHVL